MILLCLVVGFVLGVYITDRYDMNGVEDLWKRFVETFKKTSAKAQESFSQKLVASNSTQ